MVKYGDTKDVVFHEAVNFLKKKKVFTEEVYHALDEQSQKKAFTVAGYTNIEVLQIFLDELVKSAENGETKEQFREKMNTFLVDHGYEGMSKRKSDIVFRQNIQTAFQVGHYQSMTEPTTKKLRPYWKYMTAGDGEVRDAHAAMEGKVFSADDPIWDVWYPPNGFCCRCTVVSLSKAQVERMGIVVETAAPNLVDYTTGEIKIPFPDSGFSNNPAKEEWKPDMTNISSPLQKIYEKAQKAK